MHTSRPIDIDGRFIGVAVTDATDWRFIATHPAVHDLDGAHFPDPAAAQRAAGQAMRRNCPLPVRPAGW
jgi:hypothetical protein